MRRWCRWRLQRAPLEITLAPDQVVASAVRGPRAVPTECAIAALVRPPPPFARPQTWVREAPSGGGPGVRFEPAGPGWPHRPSASRRRPPQAAPKASLESAHALILQKLSDRALVAGSGRAPRSSGSRVPSAPDGGASSRRARAGGRGAAGRGDASPSPRRRKPADSSAGGRARGRRHAGQPPASPAHPAKGGAGAGRRRIRAGNGAPPTREAPRRRLRRAARDAAFPPLTDHGRGYRGGRRWTIREREAVMTFASGNLTVADRDGAVVQTVPYSGILGVSYSRSGQPSAIARRSGSHAEYRRRGVRHLPIGPTGIRSGRRKCSSCSASRRNIRTLRGVFQSRRRHRRSGPGAPR